MIDASANDTEIVRFLAEVRESGESSWAFVADLARILANSGEIFCPEHGATFDVASTGGPSSLSTLLCPLFLRAAGCTVVKLGVPGRPAGGVDCLAQLPGYRVVLAEGELRTILDDCGYAHFVSSGRYAPLDARMFRLRQQNGALAYPPLVAASLLSKKLAVGVRSAGLDIRVYKHANFGSTWAEAKENALLFSGAADLLGIEAHPVLTDGQQPYQPFVGRRESLAALWLIFESRAPSWLVEHLELCRTLSLACAPIDARLRIARASPSDLQREFSRNLRAQGASIENFDQLAMRTLAEHSVTVRSASDGFVDYSLHEIRRVLVGLQGGVVREGEFCDPAGAILLRKPGDWVHTGDEIATLRLQANVEESVTRRLRVAMQKVSETPIGERFEAVRA